MTEIGHNNPPEPTSIEVARETLSDLEMEAGHWFDGSEIETDEQAAEVSRLLDAARKAKTGADNARKIEKKPHDDAAKAVDAAYKPILTGFDRVVECARAVTTTWLVEQDHKKREAEARARAEADAAAAEARRLASETDGSLAAAKARDVAIEQAEAAQVIAARAANDKANAKGAGMGRAIGLRSIWRAEITDRRALLNHVAIRDPDALTAFLTEWAAREVRGGTRDVPGCNVWEERVAA